MHVNPTVVLSLPLPPTLPPSASLSACPLPGTPPASFSCCPSGWPSEDARSAYHKRWRHGASCQLPVGRCRCSAQICNSGVLGFEILKTLGQTTHTTRTIDHGRKPTPMRTVMKSLHFSLLAGRKVFCVAKCVGKKDKVVLKSQAGRKKRCFAECDGKVAEAGPVLTFLKSFRIFTQNRADFDFLKKK